MSDQFIVHRLRSKPVEYTILIRHFVIAGEWHMGVTIQDLAEGSEVRLTVADDLRYAADLLDKPPAPTAVEETK